MKHRIDIDRWIRRDHFLFFRDFDEPYHGVCVRVDCTTAYVAAKSRGCSFFLYYLYQSLVAAQQLENFRYRIEDGEPVLYDQIDAGAAIGRTDGTFGYGSMLYRETLDEFLVGADAVMDRVRNSSGLHRETQNNLIRYSALPWIDFTSLSHARKFTVPDSCPRITFGKVTEVGGRRSMPVSIHVHHALVDGLHVGQFLERFQELMNAAG